MSDGSQNKGCCLCARGRGPIYIRLTRITCSWKADLGWADCKYNPLTKETDWFPVYIEKHKEGLLVDVTGWEFADASAGEGRAPVRMAYDASEDKLSRRSYWVLETLEEIERRIRMAMVGSS